MNFRWLVTVYKSTKPVLSESFSTKKAAVAFMDKYNNDPDLRWHAHLKDLEAK